MNDTTPERVWQCWVGHNGIGWVECAEDHPDAVPYVPESRALAAEQERDALSREIYERLENGTAHMVICNGDHSKPLWDVKPGVLCNCPIGHHFKELHRDLAAYDRALAEEVALERRRDDPESTEFNNEP